MKNILLMFSHDVEDVEAIATRALLVRAGLNVVTATFQKSLQIETAFGIKVNVDFNVEELNLDDFDMLVIPGGKYVQETIDIHDKMQIIAKKFYSEKKPIAAICAGPRFLDRAGILDDVEFTAHPATGLDSKENYRNVKALTSKNVITAKGAGCVYEFVDHIVNFLLGAERAKNLKKSIQLI